MVLEKRRKKKKRGKKKILLLFKEMYNYNIMLTLSATKKPLKFSS
jgi:hypothetical protein